MDLTTVEPGLALLHDEAGHAAVPRRGGGIGQREERERIALAAIGDEHLRAGDEVAVAVPPRHRAQGLDVGARVRLGEAEAAARLAAGEARQEPRALLVRPVVEHDQRGHGVAIEDAGERHEPAADLLDHPRIGRDVEAEPAIGAAARGRRRGRALASARPARADRRRRARARVPPARPRPPRTRAPPRRSGAGWGWTLGSRTTSRVDSTPEWTRA